MATTELTFNLEYDSHISELALHLQLEYPSASDPKVLESFYRRDIPHTSFDQRDPQNTALVLSAVFSGAADKEDPPFCFHGYLGHGSDYLKALRFLEQSESLNLQVGIDSTKPYSERLVVRGPEVFVSTAVPQPLARARQFKESGYTQRLVEKDLSKILKTDPLFGILTSIYMENINTDKLFGPQTSALGGLAFPSLVKFKEVFGKLTPSKLAQIRGATLQATETLWQKDWDGVSEITRSPQKYREAVRHLLGTVKKGYEYDTDNLGFTEQVRPFRPLAVFAGATEVLTDSQITDKIHPNILGKLLHDNFGGIFTTNMITAYLEEVQD